MEFKDRLKDLMKNRGIQSPEELSNELVKLNNGSSIHANTIRNYLKGKPPNNFEKYEILANFFGVSTDYLQGYTNTESINVDTKYFCNEYGLSENVLKKLKEYKNNPIEIYTINLILNQKGFIKRLSDYLVSSNIYEIIEENDFLSKFTKMSLFLDYDILESRKYKYYSLLEILPSLYEYSKQSVSKYLLSNKDILFEYCNNRLENQRPIDDFDIRALSEEEMEQYQNDIEEAERNFAKELEAFENLKETKKILKEYEEYNRSKEEGENK